LTTRSIYESRDPPTVVCAPDKFRDSVTAPQAAAALAAGAIRSGWVAVTHPIADGGEGSRQAIAASQAVTTRSVDAVDALDRRSTAPYLILEDGTAVVVAADVIGLDLIPASRRDPMRSSSRGLAAPILAAVRDGARKVVVFLGGVATVDAGLGLLSALGADPRDVDGRPLATTANNLAAVHTLELSEARSAMSGIELVAATDVVSPLHGPDGAAHRFAAQKGADPEQVGYLDHGLHSLAPLLGEAAARPGSGAAGGIGAALMALGATQVSGAEFILRMTRFAERLSGADLCLTGEGSVDVGTAAGKAVSAVVSAAVQACVPCVVLGGTVTDDADELYARGACGLLAIGRRPRSLSDAFAATAADLESTARAICGVALAQRHSPNKARR
jgi:glycerate kinase